METRIFPWNNNEKPFWINLENGFEWYIDKYMTDYCMKGNSLPQLEAICFYVCENKNGKINPLMRILIDKKTNNILGSSTSLEGIACKIDILRIALKRDKIKGEENGNINNSL